MLMRTTAALAASLVVALVPLVGCDASPRRAEAAQLPGGTNAAAETPFLKTSSLETPAADDAVADDAVADYGARSELPRPSDLSVGEFERHLFPFLKQRRYEALRWRRDKTVRDTGPFIKGAYYGTHPAVRVYYSPEVMRWLAGGRVGEIPDGAMIVKEQFKPPAIRHRGKSEQELRDSLESWTVMVKDRRGSHDGWFWSNPGADAEVVDHHKTNAQPYSGFGMYCIRCHASTQSPSAASVNSPDNEFTFASLRNIEGFSGQPILFRVDQSWREESPAEQDEGSDAEDTELGGSGSSASLAADDRHAAFDAFYHRNGAAGRPAMDALPPSSFDTVPSRCGEPAALATSDQCMSCHAGVTGPFGPVGFVHTGESTGYGDPGLNISPYGEWRWTPMGLAGRDPVFYAQLESEVAMIQKQFGASGDAQKLADTLVDTCLRCHGALGHQQFHQNRDAADLLPLEDVTTVSALEWDAHPTDVSPPAVHGAMARDGVSCMICHRMQPRPQDANDARPYLQFFLESSITGNVHLGPPGEIYGPYEDDQIETYAMHHATGWKPVHSDYLRQSQLCGSCHTVSLPTIDRPLGDDAEAVAEEAALTAGETVAAFKPYRHHLEQTTYLEWLNSQYNNETDASNPQGQSCQECHMHDATFPDEVGALAGTIHTKIAAIQDDTYPDAENLATHQALHVRIRDSYRRHGFAGLNIWLLEFFNQFDDVLGVKKQDYMTGSDQGAAQAIAGMVRTAEQTAALTVTANLAPSEEGNVLEAVVDVKNLTGHRFPSGVAFRRAFVELLVLEESEDDNAERIVWSSGRTNPIGAIVDGSGVPLVSEVFSADGEQTYQPHHRVITSSDQVQIYETLLKDNEDLLTTSFVRGCETVKDNRLLPKGWSTDGPGGGLSGVFLAATHPGPLASDDADFVDGTGRDQTLYRVRLPEHADPNRMTIRATLYYQALPPYYLRKLFSTAPDGEATQRLYALVRQLQLDGTPIENWKLKIATASATLTGSQR